MPSAGVPAAVRRSVPVAPVAGGAPDAGEGPETDEAPDELERGAAGGAAVVMGEV